MVDVVVWMLWLEINFALCLSFPKFPALHPSWRGMVHQEWEENRITTNILCTIYDILPMAMGEIKPDVCNFFT